MKKYILIILLCCSVLLIVYLFRREKAKREFVAFCKTPNNYLYIAYFDSMHGISKIKKCQEKDTLSLEIYVRLLKRNVNQTIKIDENVKYIRINNKSFDIDSIEKCYEPLDERRVQP